MKTPILTYKGEPLPRTAALTNVSYDSENEAIARQILGAAIQPDNSLASLDPDYVAWGATDDSGEIGDASLDGGFSFQYLKAIVWWMENMREAPKD